MNFHPGIFQPCFSHTLQGSENRLAHETLFSQPNEKSISAERFLIRLRLIPTLRDEGELKDN
mgnify:CR=1 FL=1